jgi:hypothetical protein
VHVCGLTPQAMLRKAVDQEVEWLFCVGGSDLAFGGSGSSKFLLGPDKAHFHDLDLCVARRGALQGAGGHLAPAE